MRLKLDCTLNDLLVEGVADIVLDCYYDSLVHLIAYNHTYSGLS